MNGVVIRQVRYDALVVQALVAEAMAELGQRYGGEGDGTPLQASDFGPPEGAFLVAYVDDQPVGCGGWRSHGEGGKVAELKRLYTVPAARRTGVARQILVAVEDSARASGRSRMVLECGDRQPEAIKLYESAGYGRIEDFGFYRDSPEVVSLGRDL